MSLELVDVCSGYPSAPQLLRGVNLRIERGEVVGIRGDSGAGKSTMLNIAALLKSPASGRVVVAGQPVDQRRPVPLEIRTKIGIVPQSTRAATDPRQRLGALLAAPLAFADGAIKVHPERYRDQLHRLCLRVELDPGLLQRRAAEVSDGQLQRVLLARALSLDPWVLVCDEPTAQLDEQTKATILRLLTAQAAAGSAVLLASHDAVGLHAICDRVLDFPGSFMPPLATARKAPGAPDLV
ncbi:ABC transporter ATP-binding protein [Arthrobacter sp. MYb229]|uniref:ATP-binding cassette domain-containing protein n=1 Tax=unclassified Arthrobacter TaxID=235627 RepID=UPI000CFD9954|nr:MULTISPECIES: ATP-binding cassette domain-containing protein [unclassified Arthrobacter]PRA03238.1 ABC transporter ATP-binding protein [Arthrobacter sp. MYb229]PRB49708.1 ABC transporter ATP-binding protein [Arthrobacter sp. MYb216]